MLCLLYIENLILLLLFFQCGRSMNPNFIFSWPQARVGVASQAHITQASSKVSCDTVHVRRSKIIIKFIIKNCDHYTIRIHMHVCMRLAVSSVNHFNNDT